MEPCNIQSVCDTVDRHEQDIQTLWNETFGEKTSNFIATGNIGGVVASDGSTLNAIDEEDIAKGGIVINDMNPAGLFLVGGMTFSPPSLLANVAQGKLLKPFSKLFYEKKLWPVMSEYDYDVIRIAPGATVTDKMAYTVLAMFSYLPDAKRYYSVYDQYSNTEFYVLSSGRRATYGATDTNVAFVYPNDPTVTQEQYLWLLQKTASTPAKNRVVIFDAPFTSIVDEFRGTTGQGAVNVKADFQDWDFEGMGIKLVITGHTGNSFRLRKGVTDIVNVSAFLRSRLNLALSSVASPGPPQVSTLYGKQGYSIEYFSNREMGQQYRGTTYPGGVAGNYITPKTEFFHMKCSRDGIVCEFISYDTDATTSSQINASKTIEHSFKVSSL